MDRHEIAARLQEFRGEPGWPLNAAELDVSPDGSQLLFTATSRPTIGAVLRSSLWLTDLHAAPGSSARRLTDGPGDRCGRWSPDGRFIAYIPEQQPGQVAVLDVSRCGSRVDVAPVEGVVESVWWDPAGHTLVALVAGSGADRAGAAGSGGIPESADDVPSWAPRVRSSEEPVGWRQLLAFDLDSGGGWRAASPSGRTIWEAAPAGTSRTMTVVSDAPDEGAWYSSSLVLLDLADGSATHLYTPRTQLGCLSAAPSGRRVAVVEALCSDRTVVAGDLLVIDVDSGAVEPRPLDFDVTWTQWIDDDRIALAGVRGLTTVLATIDATTGALTTLLESADTCGDRYPVCHPVGASQVVAVREGFHRPPTITLIGFDVEPRDVLQCARGAAEAVAALDIRVDHVDWTAADGLSIQGVLLRPPGDGPHPLLVHAHGGPVWAHRDRWLAGYPLTMLFLEQGYAVLHPNPRGSGGRGQEFARRVVGDMLGADARDIEAGVDHLVALGIADASRVGVYGGSYGGYLSCHLAATSNRFAAAVPIAPVSDRVSYAFTSNISAYLRIFLGPDPTDPTGLYFDRSPAFRVTPQSAPSLVVAGLRDRCTPPAQAVEFHRALVGCGVDTDVVLYPEEGHGVRAEPAAADLGARMLDWFSRYLDSPDVPELTSTSRGAHA